MSDQAITQQINVARSTNDYIKRLVAAGPYYTGQLATGRPPQPIPALAQERQVGLVRKRLRNAALPGMR